MPTAARIYYYASKTGAVEDTPVILIHGAGGTHLHWPSEIRRLPGFRLYALDLPGHGKSEGRGLQSIQAYADSVLNWMGAVDLHSAVLIGHSMGGAIALTLAKKHPERILGLGLVGTGAKLRVAPDILENTASTQTISTAIAAIISRAFSTHADSRLVELAQRRMAETRPSVFHGDLKACDEFDVIHSLSTIKTPTQVICGQEDELTPMRYSQYLADQIPGASCTAIAEAGHMVMLEKPRRVAEVLSNFLDTIPYHPGQSIRASDS